jgi:N-acyl-D-aspartate/D-glutamate deacylase
MTLEEAVWRMAGQPAAIFGVPDRGVLAPGKVADIVAFDADRIAETERERVWDFPGGGDRLISRNIGIEHVWIAGQPIVRDHALVEGAAPGALLRC